MAAGRTFYPQGNIQYRCRDCWYRNIESTGVPNSYQLLLSTTKIAETDRPASLRPHCRHGANVGDVVEAVPGPGDQAVAVQHLGGETHLQKQGLGAALL